MTEPEEVEEDLFADLYDGDENAGPGNAAAPVAPQQSSIDTAMKTNDAPGYGEEPETAYDPVSFDVEPSGQDESMDGTQNLKQYRDHSEKPSQREPFGINMKEDG